MCELFGLSSSAPVGMTYALHEFATHGGLIHKNKSGWGIAYRQDRDAILIKEPSPARPATVSGSGLLSHIP